MIGSPGTGGGYRRVAGEYYDPQRHPTSAAFRAASVRLLARWLARRNPAGFPPGAILEVGAGRSVLGVLLPDSLPPPMVAVTDVEPQMLAHSAGVAHRHHRVAAAAEHLPFASGSFATVVASLGDPYNSPAFWSEAARVLTPGGHVVFTTPSQAWAIRFRTEHEPGERDRANFALRDGSQVSVLSSILDPQEQRNLITNVGLTVDDVDAVWRDEEPLALLAPKLETAGEDPIVTLYSAHLPVGPDEGPGQRNQDSSRPE